MVLGGRSQRRQASGPETVRRGLAEFVGETGANELMVTANIFDHAKRKRSFEILAELHGGMKPPRVPEAEATGQAGADQL